MDQGFRPLFPSKARLVSPLALALSALAPQGPGRYSALGMEALLGRGVDGWSIETSDGFGLRGGAGRLGPVPVLA